MNLVCELCGSGITDSFHHLIPRTVHTNKWFKKRYTREQLSQGIDVCRSCHRAIHNIIPDAKELGREYNALEKLKAHPKIASHIEWRKKTNKLQTSKGGR